MERLLQALACQNVGRPPIWLMRQAGRYMPQYQKIRQGRSLLEMFHDVETVVNVTMLPIEHLDVDAAILFTDILTVLNGLHIGYDFQEGIGPVIYDHPEKMQLIDPEQAYPHLVEAIIQLRQKLKVPLLGFAGAPFTIVSYIIEGKSSRDLKKTKEWWFQNPTSFKALLQVITEATIRFLYCQIDAGVQAVQLFDSWANALDIEEFREISLKPMAQIVDAIKKKKIPIILFSRGSSLFAEELASLKPTAISIDWSGDLKEIRKKIPKEIALQGNLDPMALFAPPQRIQQKVDQLLDSMHQDPGYIFNLGHGILPETPFENVQFLVNYVRHRFESLMEA